MQETGFNPRVRKIPGRRKWQTTPVFLPGETHGQRSLAGYSPWGLKEIDTTQRLTTRAKFSMLLQWFTHRGSNWSVKEGWLPLSREVFQGRRAAFLMRSFKVYLLALWKISSSLVGLISSIHSCILNLYIYGYRPLTYMYLRNFSSK